MPTWNAGAPKKTRSPGCGLDTGVAAWRWASAVRGRLLPALREDPLGVARAVEAGRGGAAVHVGDAGQAGRDAEDAGRRGAEACGDGARVVAGCRRRPGRWWRWRGAAGLVGRRWRRLGRATALLDLDDSATGFGLGFGFGFGLTTPVKPIAPKAARPRPHARGRRSRRRPASSAGRCGGRAAGRRRAWPACVSGDADAGRLNEATRPPETASTAEALPIGLAERADGGRQRGDRAGRTGRAVAPRSGVGHVYGPLQTPTR